MRHSKIKRILIIEACYENFGSYFRAIGLSQALSSHKIHVDMVFPSSQKYAFFIKIKKENHYLQLIKLPRINCGLFLNLRVLRGIISTIIGLFGSYDIIQATAPSQPESIIPAVLLKLFGKKVVIDWDDYISDGEIKNPIINAYIKFCESNFPRFFKNYVVVSDFLEELAYQFGAKKVFKLINGVNLSQFVPQNLTDSRHKLGMDQNDNYLISFGNTYTPQRAFLLLKTFEYIYQQKPTTKLIISFDPQAIPGLKHQFNQKMFKNIISGYINQEQLPFYLGAANAVIFLFGDNPNERGCFPIRIGTYLNGEKLIFINDNDSTTTRLLKKYSAAIVQKDIKILAQKAIDYLNHPQKYSSYIPNIKLAKQQLSWNKIIIPLINFYQKIL